VEHRKTTPFKSAAGVLSVPGMEKIGIALQSKIQATSSIYRLVSRGRVKDTTRIIETVARITGNKATILYWREY
jgi:general secretion pathway protein K